MNFNEDKLNSAWKKLEESWGMAEAGPEAAQVSESNPKYAEFAQAVKDGISKATVKDYHEHEPYEAPSGPTYSSGGEPGSPGYEFYTNEVTFPITPNIKSKEDLELFKNYVYGFDPAKNELVSTIFETILDNPSKIFDLSTLGGDDFSYKPSEGWTEAKVIRKGNVFYFQGTYESSSDELERSIDFQSWTEERDTSADNSKSFPALSNIPEPKPTANWSSKNYKDKMTAVNLAGKAAQKGQFKVGDHKVGGKYQTYKDSPWKGKSARHGKPFGQVGKEITESKKKFIEQAALLLEAAEKVINEKCWKGYKQIGMKDKGGKEVPNCVPVKEKAPAWQREEGKNPEGGLNAKGRASAKKQGHDLKPPVSAKQAKKSPKSAARRKSFCARMKGMKSKMTGSEKKNDPDSRINKSLRKWDC